MSSPLSSPPSGSTPSKSPKKRRFVLEKAMLVLTAVFILGMLAYTFLGEPWRGIAVGLISGLTFVVMFF